MVKENQKDRSEMLRELDESLRIKYRDILESLSINELQRFPINKGKYKSLIMSEIYEHFPEADSKLVDETAQYISNYLDNEAPRMKAKNLQMLIKTQSRRQTRSFTSEHEINCQNSEHPTTDDQVEPTETMTKKESIENELSETVLKALDSSMSSNSTLESTVTESFLDDTYATETNNDDSITELKQVTQSKEDRNTELKQPKQKTKKKKKKKKKKKTKVKPANSTNGENMDRNSEVKCTDSCLVTEQSSVIRCNMCMVWFHTICAGISDVLAAQNYQKQWVK